MDDWNVVVTVRERGFRPVCEALQAYGRVRKTDYYNVITLRVADPVGFANDLQNLLEREPSLAKGLARAMPVRRTFGFQTPEEFDRKSCEQLAIWLGQLEGGSFHVRMHRRGFKGRIGSQEKEQFLDHWLLEQLAQREASGRITFEDPDYTIVVETVGQRAGISLWSRTERERYPFLKLD